MKTAPPTHAAEAGGAPNEGDALIAAVPQSVGYPLSEAQTREVAAALKNYPGSFAKVRAYALPSDIEPAFAPYAPPASARKGRAR